MKKLTNAAAMLAFLATAAPTLAEPAQAPVAAPPIAPASLATPAPTPPVTSTEATLDNRDSAGSRTLQPNANPTALLFFTLMSSGGSGRYGR